MIKMMGNADKTGGQIGQYDVDVWEQSQQD
jgi:hypothetical protein